MAEVSLRTSQRAAVSGTGENTSAAFDLHNWQGLSRILKAAKDSGMDENAYAEFRDVVLTYAQSGGTNAQLRARIESVLSAIGGGTADGRLPAHSLGRMRREPRFITSEGHPSEQSTSPSSPQEVRFTPHVKERHPENVPGPTGTGKENVPDARPSAGRTLRTVPPPAASSSPVPPVPDVPIRTLDEYKARISEIKRTVNAHMGNPVALIDRANEVGRRYMSALLAAMKAAGGGAPGTLNTSMNALERVFEEIMNLPTDVISAPASAPTPTGAKAPLQEPVKKEVGMPEPQEVRTPRPPSPPENEEAAPAPSTVSKQPLAPVSEPPRSDVTAEAPINLPVRKNEPQRWPETRQPQKPPETPQPAPLEAMFLTGPAVRSEARAHSIPSLADRIRRDSENLSRRAESPAMQPKPAPSPASSPQEEQNVPPTAPRPAIGGSRQTSSSLPKEELRKIREEMSAHAPSSQSSVFGSEAHETKETRRSPDAAAVAVTNSGDGLDTPQVDAGLTQLLSEWKLFRSSGMFGTGSGGREHPLYKKLAPMPMSIIARGAWEGAQKEEILSIRDYINGWLHEQAVMYMPTESFEHYLRRVVKKVLQRQNG